jgi:hypothetical protein
MVTKYSLIFAQPKVEAQVETGQGQDAKAGLQKAVAEDKTAGRTGP